MHQRSTLPIPRLLCAVVGLVVASGVHAQSSTAELEARLAALESTIAELKAELAATRAAVPAPPPAPAPGAAPAPPPIQASTIMPAANPGTRFTAGGFIKLDSMYTRTDGGEIGDGTAGRLFYLPSAIPVGGLDEGTDLDMHAQFSRLWFAADTTLDSGDKLRGYLEFDLFGGALGNETATNTYGLAIRHAYVSWNQWLAGQTWSNFQDVAVLPDAVDFVGPSEGTVFVRQAQLRYSNGPWAFSMENPETLYTPRLGGATKISSDDNNLPDVTARYTWKRDWGHVSLAGMVRQLKYETTGATGDSDTAIGAGLSLSGKYNVNASNDLRFMLTGGKGLGRYIGLAIDSDAVLDAQGDLDSTDALAGFLGWRHVFSPQWRGNLFGSFAHFDHDPAQSGGGITAKVHSYHANLIYSPLPKLDVGAELIFANREVESGVDGDFTRLHMHVKYSF